MCTSVWIVGCVVRLIRYSTSDFEPFAGEFSCSAPKSCPHVASAVLGGVIWTHGNLQVIPIMSTLGLGMGA
jgi:hypothetical protein